MRHRKLMHSCLPSSGWGEHVHVNRILVMAPRKSFGLHTTEYKTGILHAEMTIKIQISTYAHLVNDYRYNSTHFRDNHRLKPVANNVLRITG